MIMSISNKFALEFLPSNFVVCGFGWVFWSIVGSGHVLDTAGVDFLVQASL